MKRVKVASYPVSIFMAGDVEQARKECRYLADWWGMCVAITPNDYVYTGGSEAGFTVGFINYPRFPADPDAIWKRAEEVAAWLRVKLGQQSYTIQAPDQTVWFSHRPEDAVAHLSQDTAS